MKIFGICLIMTLSVILTACKYDALETIKSVDDDYSLKLSSGRVVALEQFDFKSKSFIGEKSRLLNKEIIFISSTVQRPDTLVEYGEIYIIGLNSSQEEKRQFEFKGFTNVDLGLLRGKGKVLTVRYRSMFSAR